MLEKILYKIRLNKKCRKCKWKIECIRGYGSCWKRSEIVEEIYNKKG